MPRITNEHEIPLEIRDEGIVLYFRHFHNQPYPLLMGTGDNPQASVAEYPKLVLFPLLAVSLCACQHAYFQNRDAIAETRRVLSEAAWSLLSARYSEFDFDLPYFQALCLLAQADFASKCQFQYGYPVLKPVRSWQAAPGSGSSCPWPKDPSDTWLASQRRYRTIRGSLVARLAFGRVDTVHDGSHFQWRKCKILLCPGFIFSALPDARRPCKS